jgi:hypothetical protein
MNRKTRVEVYVEIATVMWVYRNIGMYVHSDQTFRCKTKHHVYSENRCFGCMVAVLGRLWFAI